MRKLKPMLIVPSYNNIFAMQLATVLHNCLYATWAP